MSKGRILHGTQFNPRDNFTVGFTQQEMDKAQADALLSQAATEITPTDRDSSLVRVYTPPTAALDAYAKFVDTRISGVDLPDVLESITVAHSTVKADGFYSATANGASVGSNPSVSVSLDGNAQGSVSLVVNVTPVVRTFWGSNVKARIYFFKLTGNISQATVIAKLSSLFGITALAWPRFNPQPVILQARSQEVSLKVNVDVKQSVGLGSTASYINSTGAGYSQSVGNTNQTITIPPTLHSGISILDASASDRVHATASAGWSGGTNWPALTRTQSLDSVLVQSSVSPAIISATSPTDVPTTGKYLYRYDTQEEEWGYAQVAAIVIDFADL